jgi:tryptophanyl-tRNA synthetase
MSRINLTDNADTIAKKLKKAKTDPEPLPSEVEGLKDRPEADNLVGIYAALAKTDKASILKEFGGAQFSKFKPALVELAVEKLAPIASDMKRISEDRAYIDEVLKDGGERANEIASKHLRVVKDIVGFLQT